MAKTQKDRTKKPQEVTMKADEQKDARIEFEERFEFFMSQFRTVCQEAGVPVAFAIVIDPKNSSTPFVFGHGHIYDQGTLVAGALRDIKRRINEELSA